MNLNKLRRKRGIVLTREGWQKFQNAKLELEFHEKYGEKFTLEELSGRTQLTTATLAKILTREEGVDKRTLINLFTAFNLELNTSDYSQPSLDAKQPECAIAFTHQDWGDVIDVSIFYGRAAELATLEQWIIESRCRVVTLLGVGGIGKSTLAAKLAEQVKDKFEFFLWRSLSNAPSLKDLLDSLLQFFSNEQQVETALPDNNSRRLSQLIDYLQKYRCLLLLDNTETIMQCGVQTGRYCQGCEDYGQLFKRLGEVPHQSCVLLTSREKPKELALLEGEALPVRSLQLSGLSKLEVEKIFRLKGISGSDKEWQTLAERYAGNPLALKIIATTIGDIFNGSILEFLQQTTIVFGELRELLEQQVERLSDIEKELIYWLVINREPVSILQLQNDIFSQLTLTNLLEALESLRRRSLVEKSAALFTLQPVVMEYVTAQLIGLICAEIVNQKIVILRKIALLKVQSQERVKAVQINCLIEPILEELLTIFRTKSQIKQRLSQLLAKLRIESPHEAGYTAGNLLNLLCYLQTDLTNYDFSHLNIWQADLRQRTLHNVNFAYADLSKSIFTKSFSNISAIAFSYDGKVVAVSDARGEICLWREFIDGEQILTLQGHTDWVQAIAFCPDRELIGSVSTDQTLRLWNISTGQCLRTWQGHSERIHSVAFSPQGHAIASSSDDRTVKLWDISTGECIRTMQGHTDWVFSVTFSPQGHILVSGGRDRTIRCWDVNTGRIVQTLQGHTDCIRTVAFCPDGQTFASGCDDRTVKIWDVSTGKCCQTLHGHTGWVLSVCYSPDGQILASSSSDRTIRLWRAVTGECIKVLSGHTGAIQSTTFSPDGNTLASSCDGQTAMLWDVSTGEALRTARGYHDGVWSVVFSPDGKTIATSDNNQKVKLWDTSTGQCRKALQGHTGWIRTVTFSPDGQTFASGCDDRTVKIWHTSNGQCCQTLEGHASRVKSITFNPQGNVLASGSDDRTVRLWNLSTGQCVNVLEHTHGVWSVAFSPQGKILATGCDDQKLWLWDCSSGECDKILQGHAGWILSVIFLPIPPTPLEKGGEEGILASGSKDKTVRLWDVSTGQCLKILEGHTGWVTSVACSAQAPAANSRDSPNLLASGSTDATVKLWNVSTGECVKTFQGHTHWIRSVAFCPQGKILASSSEDETVKLWDISTGECIRTLRSKKPYEGMNVTGVTGLTVAAIASLKALGAVEHLEE
ncbi:hypothetical protein C7B80_09550 [Cyanosarcina cf. burmensis CCALA 770]|nr:hypothetical protein C7B80_09550 [Cyanosarcina cf. burmensis CCALA 770]